MTLADAYGALIIVGIVAGGTLLTELFSYFTVYTSETYQHACERVVDLNKRLLKEDAKVVSQEKRKNHEKIVERIEDDLKLASQKMDAQKLKGNLMSGVFFFFLYRMVAAAWTGHVVARLPFVPVKFIHGLSFRGLAGDDKTLCSFGLIYTLCTVGIKANIPKLFGFVSPKSLYDASRMAERQRRKEEQES